MIFEFIKYGLNVINQSILAPHFATPRTPFRVSFNPTFSPRLHGARRVAPLVRVCRVMGRWANVDTPALCHQQVVAALSDAAEMIR